MKKKGFTLIELLAIIILLGLIAVIAVPMINDLITKAKVKSYKVTADNFLSSVISDCKINHMEDEDITTQYIFDKVNGSEFQVKGEPPIVGFLNLTNDCKIETMKISNGSYSAYIEDGVVDSGKGQMALPSGLEIGTAVYINPDTNAICTKADADKNVNKNKTFTNIKNGCMGWHVFKENGDGTYELILDHNTTASIMWNSTGKNNLVGVDVLNQLEVDSKNWFSLIKNTVRIISADEIAHIVGADREDTLNWKSTNGYYGPDASLNQTNWFYLDGATSANPTNYENGGWQTYIYGFSDQSLKSKYDWLFNNTRGCEFYGCTKIDSFSNYTNPSGTYLGNTYGYWTSSAALGLGEYRAWIVRRQGFLRTTPILDESGFGIRPVITF